jgi:hypothetical protein
LVALRARLGGMNGRSLASSAARIAIASAVMGAACLLSTRSIHFAFGAGRLSQLADVAISIPLGVAVFYAAARALRVPELEALRAAISGPLRSIAKLRRVTLR